MNHPAPLNSSASDKTPFRIPWVDYVKGISIAYIVFTHAQGGLRGRSPAWMAVYESFHFWVDGYVLACFFFMSGLFITGAVRKPFGGFLVNRLRTAVYPYVVWVILFTLGMVAMGRFTNNEASLAPIWGMFHDPPFHYWFVYALIVISVAHVGLRKLGLKNIDVLLVFLVAYLLEDWLSVFGWRGLRFVCGYGPFFALAAWIGRDGVIAQLSRAPTRQVGAVLMGAAVLAYLGTVFGLKVEGQPTHLLVAPCGLTALICTAILLQRFSVLRFIEGWGRRSLEIYVAHVFGTAGARIVLDQLFGVGDSLGYALFHIGVGMAVGLYLPIGLAAGAERLGVPYLFSLKPRRAIAKPAPAEARA